MAKSSIIEKIIQQFESDISEESHVVYVLTRIGKILEIDRQRDNYPTLSFYRDWSVHQKIDRHSSNLPYFLKEFINLKENRHIFLAHISLREELNKFLVTNRIKALSEIKLDEFVYYLGKVISDTPVVFNLDNSKYILIISEPPRVGWSGTYSLSVIVEVAPVESKTKVNQVTLSTN